MAGELTEAQRRAILAAVGGSDYKKSAKAKNWVGPAVGYAMGLDLEGAAASKKAGTIVTALFKEGALIKVEEHDPIGREMAVFVRAA